MQRGLWSTVAICKKRACDCARVDASSACARSIASQLIAKPPPITAAASRPPIRHPMLNRRRMDCLANARISAAATNIGDGGVDLGIGRPRLLHEQGSDRHDHSALAIATLRNL